MGSACTKKCLIFAPFWNHSPHVGIYRIDRFIRWLNAENITVVLVRAGGADTVRTEPWGTAITIRDPLRLYPDTVPNTENRIFHRRPNKLRKMAAYLIFNPDPSILWAKRAASHQLVRQYAHDAMWVLSSSPPESAHVAAAAYARSLGASLIVDMRDGWIDEPLKPLLRLLPLQRLREGRIESRILRQAEKIFVTSPQWKSHLEKRLPFTRDKIAVLTNSYPSGTLFEKLSHSEKKTHDTMTIMYVGRFTGSRSTRKVQYLLEPLCEAITLNKTAGRIVFLGALNNEDFRDMDNFKLRLMAHGWTLDFYPPVSRTEMVQLIDKADGFLLLTVTESTIPCKLFEYIPTGKPIFAVTRTDSAVWDIGMKLPQVFLGDYAQKEKAAAAATSFIDACKMGPNTFKVPNEFSESYHAKLFIKELVSM